MEIRRAECGCVVDRGVRVTPCGDAECLLQGASGSWGRQGSGTSDGATRIGRRMTEERIRENQLRRMAAMQGFHLQKSRRRDRQAPDYGRWCLSNPNRNAVILENADLDEVEAWLNLPWAEKLK